MLIHWFWLGCFRKYNFRLHICALHWLVQLCLQMWLKLLGCQSLVVENLWGQPWLGWCSGCNASAYWVRSMQWGGAIYAKDPHQSMHCNASYWQGYKMSQITMHITHYWAYYKSVHITSQCILQHILHCSPVQSIAATKEVTGNSVKARVTWTAMAIIGCGA